VNGRARAEGNLQLLLDARGVTRLHATVAHDGGVALAVVVLEGD
jgi:phosphopantetheinyl transferase (holo-ACP synthase)